MTKRLTLFASGMILLGAGVARPAPDTITLSILVDGRVPDTQGMSHASLLNQDFQDPAPTVDWLTCEADKGMLHVTVALNGQAPEPAACREGDREVSVVLAERPQWQKDLDAMTLRAGQVNVLAAPSQLHIVRSFSVEPAEAPPEVLPDVDSDVVECTPLRPDGAQLQVSWRVPTQPVEATCWVEPEQGAAFPLVFRLDPIRLGSTL